MRVTAVRFDTLNILLMAIWAAAQLGNATQVAHADPVGEAHQGMAAANNQFYEAIKANPNASNIREAKARFLAPAEAQMKRAMVEQFRSTAQKHSDPPGRKGAKKVMALGLKPGAGSGATSTPEVPPTVQGNARGGSTSVGSGGDRPAVVLDGKNVPHEMSFGGDAKNKPAESQSEGN